MALRNIVKEGDEILTKRAREVSEINDRIRQLLDDMIDTMRENDGVGLAAPQVGVLRRVFVVEVDDKIYELINPEIIETEGIQTGEEGCLSVPGCIGTVERPAYIKMKGLDRYGNEIEVEGTELLAVALSHEYDHLEGILFVNKALEVKEIDEIDENDHQ
ncbi:MAG: peptide deformylase [Anaerovoracaceae bacterium]